MGFTFSSPRTMSSKEKPHCLLERPTFARPRLGEASAAQEFSFHRLSSNQISKALLLWTICQDPETALLHKGAGIMKFIKLDSFFIKETKHFKSLFKGEM